MTYSLNLGVGIAGLIFMLLGIILIQHPQLSVPLTGVGSSIMAAALVNWTLSRHLESIPITPIVEALARKVEFIRTKHQIELTFRRVGDFVHLEKRQRYNLRNPSRYRKPKTVMMFTDAATAAIEPAAGFQLVVEPDGSHLEAESLRKHVTLQNGKYTFTKTYDLQPGDENVFEFRSTDRYRLHDRMTWTVQDLSEDLMVRLINKTGVPNPFFVKINHHREQEVVARMKGIGSEQDEVLLQFDSEILPYQGFEIMWNITNSNKHQQSVNTSQM